MVGISSSKNNSEKRSQTPKPGDEERKSKKSQPSQKERKS
jgi:hypothetical protein